MVLQIAVKRRNKARTAEPILKGGEQVTHKEWTRAAKAAKALKGQTYGDIAGALYYDTNYIACVISGSKRSKRCEKVVSNYLGIDAPTN